MNKLTRVAACVATVLVLYVVTADPSTLLLGFMLMAAAYVVEASPTG